MNHIRGFRKAIAIGGLSVVAFTRTAVALQQVAQPRLTPEGTFTGEPTVVTVTAQVAVDSALIPTSINLIARPSPNNSVVLGRMYDDGTHGDSLAGDGIFSLQILVSEPNRGILNLAATAAYRGRRSRVSSPSAEFQIGIRPSDTQLDVASQVPSDGQNFFELRRAQVGDEQAKRELLEALATEPGVHSFGTSLDGFYIWILFDGGLRGGIVVAPSGTKGAISYVGDSKNVALAPYFSTFQPFDETDNIVNDLGSSCVGAPFVYKNADGTVDAFRQMSGSGIVAISAHGAISGDGQVVVLTSEPVTLASRVEHFLDWTLYNRLENWGGVWAIRPSFVSAYCHFDHSIIYVSACNSAANSSLRDAFLRNGASTFYGYTKVVNSDYSYSTGTTLFDILSDQSQMPEDRTTQKAFDSVATKTDPNPPNAVFTMSGDPNVAIKGDLVNNGGFETGDLNGWSALGHGYTLAVAENPLSGTESARIGRWDQPYSFYGGFRGPSFPGLEPSGRDEIYQDVQLPNATTLTMSFDYDVVTYDGASYDWLDVTVENANTGEVLLRPVQQIGGIIQGSPSNWGLFYTTDWNHVSVDLSAYRGMNVRLRFSVQQDGYGDQCAAYVDDVSIKCH